MWFKPLRKFFLRNDKNEGVRFSNFPRGVRRYAGFFDGYRLVDADDAGLAQSVLRIGRDGDFPLPVSDSARNHAYDKPISRIFPYENRPVLLFRKVGEGKVRPDDLTGLIGDLFGVLHVRCPKEGDQALRIR